MHFRKVANGRYYLYIRRPAEKVASSLFLVKYFSKSEGYISSGIKIPKELIGKKIKICLEVSNGNEDKKVG